MTVKRRKGSLAWYHNSKKGLCTLVPTNPKTQGIYGVKVGMISDLVEGVLTPITLVELKEMKRLNDNQFEIDYTISKLRQKVKRTLNTNLPEEELREKILNSSYFDVVAQSKGKGTLGPVQRRNVKMQKRKAAKSGVTRKAGSMGLREPGRVVWTKPMSGKDGNSRRTIYSLKNCGTVVLKNYASLRYWIKEALVLKVKGAIPGPIGRPVFIKQASRK